MTISILATSVVEKKKSKLSDELLLCSFYIIWINLIFSDIHRARQYCFSLLDLIRYSQNPGEDLSTQAVETTP